MIDTSYVGLAVKRFLSTFAPFSLPLFPFRKEKNWLASPVSGFPVSPTHLCRIMISFARTCARLPAWM